MKAEFPEGRYASAPGQFLPDILQIKKVVQFIFSHLLTRFSENRKSLNSR
jgi:hypothetical protein